MEKKRRTEKRRNHIAVYVDDAEKREIEQAARERGLSLCEWVRRKIWKRT